MNTALCVQPQSAGALLYDSSGSFLSSMLCRCEGEGQPQSHSPPSGAGTCHAQAQAPAWQPQRHRLQRTSVMLLHMSGEGNETLTTPTLALSKALA